MQTSAAVSAFSAMDDPAFQAALERSEEAAGCLAEPLSPADAAAFHRVEALAAFFREDDEAALASFRASLTIQPAYTLPSTIAPEGSPLHALYVKAREAPPPEVAPFPAPQGRLLVVDGAPATNRPVGFPMLLQVMDTQGAVAWSGYLRPGDPVPDIAIPGPGESVEPLVAAPLPPTSQTAPPAPRTGRIVGTAGASAAAVALGLASYHYYSKWESQWRFCTEEKAGGCQQETLDTTSQWRSSAIGFGIGAGVAGALGIGLGVSLAF